MDPEENKIDIDPDYARNNDALRKVIKKEQEEGKLNPEQLSQLIREDFDKELNKRQKQLEEIEEKITKAQKLLHLVRYVLITSYYNKKSLEFSSGNDETANKVYDRQNRIHPAIKKLLGKNASLDVFGSLGKRKAVLKNCDNSEPSTSQAGLSKKIKKEHKQDEQRPTPLDSNQNCLKNRRKTQHRLVIGNISKYAPSLEDDNITHKWMVYVRGDKDKPDISHIVERVRFYLHPSYKPHDVVEVNESPFHLSRRGWGEFPLRVQIVFKCKLNKPIEIVHDLRLDKTCSGRQMLGNETLVDVYLHEDIILPVKTTSATAVNDLTQHSDTYTLHEEIHIKEERLSEYDYSENIDLSFSESDNIDFSFTPLELSTDIASQEHDYCQEEIKQGVQGENILVVEQDLGSPGCSKLEEFDCLLFDHSYCIPIQDEDAGNELYKVQNKDDHIEEVQGIDNKLRYGLDESYSMDVEKNDKKFTPTLVKTRPFTLSQPIKILLPINNKTILANGHLVATTTGSNWLSTAPVTVRTKYTIRLPANKFKNMGEILPYLMKRVPLWSSRMKEGDFKRIFPFMASSRGEFEGWNIGKRLNAEWSRAKTIRRTLEANAFPECKKWNTKTYFMYARSHLYSPVVSFSLFVRPSRELYLLNSCFASSFQQFKKVSGRSNFDNDDEINVDDVEELNLPNTSNLHLVDISDPSLKPHCTFIKEAALDSGIVLKPTEIVEGVVMNGAERMILEAVKCFAEGLIRRGHHHMVTSGHYKSNKSEIQAADIKMAMNERAEIQSIKDYRQRRFERSLFS